MRAWSSPWSSSTLVFLVLADVGQHASDGPVVLGRPLSRRVGMRHQLFGQPEGDRAVLDRRAVDGGVALVEMHEVPKALEEEVGESHQAGAPVLRRAPRTWRNFSRLVPPPDTRPPPIISAPSPGLARPGIISGGAPMP